MNIKQQFIVISFVVLTIILILSYLEMKRCETTSLLTVDCREVENKKCIVLDNRHYPLTAPAYIYSTSAYPIPYKNSYNYYDYSKTNISDHVAGKVIKPLKAIVTNVKDCPTSSSPINNLYGAVTDAASIMNILHFITGNDPQFILEHHKNDKLSAFIEDGLLYIIPEKHV